MTRARLILYALAAFAAASLIGGYLAWLHHHTRAAVEADRSAANAAAVSTARQADERAHAAVEGQIQGIQQENDRARQAAATDDDPLRAGLNSLRHDAAR